MKIVIIGSAGQLGSDLVEIYDGSDNEIVPLDHNNIDVTDFENSKEVLHSIKPEAIVNCAAYVRVDDSEDHIEHAFAVNAFGARNLAIIGKELGSILLHISTDYVFDGKKGSPYTEEDVPNPVNVYGCSKLSGEYFIKSILNRHYILRTASLYGIRGSSGKGGNFVETIIGKAKRNEDIKVVDDIIMSPTYTKDLADAIRKITDTKLPFGIYNAVNSGHCSWFQFASKILETLALDARISPIKNETLRSKARRPEFSALNNSRLKKYGIEFEDWDSALTRYLRDKGY